jgi:hypothetical protein
MRRHGGAAWNSEIAGSSTFFNITIIVGPLYPGSTVTGNR